MIRIFRPIYWMGQSVKTKYKGNGLWEVTGNYNIIQKILKYPLIVLAYIFNFFSIMLFGLHVSVGGLDDNISRNLYQSEITKISILKRSILLYMFPIGLLIQSITQRFSYFDNFSKYNIELIDSVFYSNYEDISYKSKYILYTFYSFISLFFCIFVYIKYNIGIGLIIYFILHNILMIYSYLKEEN